MQVLPVHAQDRRGWADGRSLTSRYRVDLSALDRFVDCVGGPSVQESASTVRKWVLLNELDGEGSDKDMVEEGQQ